MTVTLYTELESLMFSSQIPDIVISTTTNDEAEITLVTLFRYVLDYDAAQLHLLKVYQLLT